MANLGSPAATSGREGKESQKASSSHGRLSAGSPVSLASWDTSTEDPSHLYKMNSKVFVYVYGSEESHSAPPSWHKKAGEKDSQQQTAAGVSTSVRSWSKGEPVNVSIPHIPYSQRKKKKLVEEEFPRNR